MISAEDKAVKQALILALLFLLDSIQVSDRFHSTFAEVGSILDPIEPCLRADRDGAEEECLLAIRLQFDQ